jgi:hypothetical protein
MLGGFFFFLILFYRAGSPSSLYFEFHHLVWGYAASLPTPVYNDRAADRMKQWRELHLRACTTHKPKYDAKVTLP